MHVSSCLQPPYLNTKVLGADAIELASAAELHLPALLQVLEVVGCEFEDVGRLLPEDFLGEVGQDFLKALGDWEFLQVFAGHGSYILVISISS
jgi:hypothetical protein